MRQLLVIKCGRTYDNIGAVHGCFEQWIAAQLGVVGDRLQVVSVFDGGPIPARLDHVAGVVITGSPAMVTDRQPWSETVARWLRVELAEKHAHLPVLGICYGHQLIAHALGGRVDYNPRGREIGTMTVRATPAAAEDPLFAALPPEFPAQLTHLQSVIDLPPGATLLAASVLEPHQAYRLGERIWGVQFHPEFTPDIMRAYIDLLAPRMESEGLDPARVAAAVGSTPLAATLLQRFATLCSG